MITQLCRSKVFATALVFLVSACNLKANGLPGEYILSDQWRAFFIQHSPINNPAFMTDANYTTLRGVFSAAPDGVAKLWELGATVPIGLYKSAGITILGENGNAVKDGYLDERGNFIDDGQVYKNNNYFISFSYATNPWGKLSLGVSANISNQGNFDDPVWGAGLDLGAQYRLLIHPVFGYHAVGISYLNLIPPNKFLPNGNSRYEKMPFPAELNIQYHSAMLGRRLELDCQFGISDFFTQASNFAESKKLEWDMKLQGGLAVIPHFLSLRAFTQVSETQELDYWGFATEINIPQANNGRDLSFMYQFRDEISADLHSSHSLYARIELGLHREEAYAKRIGILASLSANDLYTKAMKLYSKEKYWDAFFIYQRILVEFPDFFLNDMVTYYAGSCLEELDMRESAERLYVATKEQFSQSRAVAMADLGLMRIFYRQEKYDLVEQQFAELNRETVPDSIRQHGCYLMGETEIRRNNLSVAHQYFNLVPEGHPAYVFAQHSSATAYALADEDVSLIVTALENCVASNPVTPAQKEIVNRALVLLGYIFYEDNTLSKAVVALRMVPQTSYYYEDALLGLGWSSVKARQWTDCKTNGQLLMSYSRKRIIQCEGALLQAYSCIMEKKYNEALTILKIASEKMRSFTNASEDSLNYKKMQYESSRMSYSFLSDNVVTTSNKGAAATVQEIEELHAKQMANKTEIDNYLQYFREFKRLDFFARNASRVTEDIEYALATVQKILGSNDFIKDQEKIKTKEANIDEELEKLRREMEKIE